MSRASLKPPAQVPRRQVIFSALYFPKTRAGQARAAILGTFCSSVVLQITLDSCGSRCYDLSYRCCCGFCCGVVVMLLLLYVTNCDCACPSGVARGADTGPGPSRQRLLATARQRQNFGTEKTASPSGAISFLLLFTRGLPLSLSEPHQGLSPASTWHFRWTEAPTCQLPQLPAHHAMGGAVPTQDDNAPPRRNSSCGRIEAGLGLF